MLVRPLESKETCCATTKESSVSQTLVPNGQPVLASQESCISLIRRLLGNICFCCCCCCCFCFCWSCCSCCCLCFCCCFCCYGYLSNGFIEFENALKYTALQGRSYANEPVYVCNRDSLYMIKHDGVWVPASCFGHAFDESDAEMLHVDWCVFDRARAGLSVLLHGMTDLSSHRCLTANQCW